MEGDEGTDDLPPVTEDIGLPTPPITGHVPPPQADPGEGNTGGKRHVPVSPGSEA